MARTDKDIEAQRMTFAFVLILVALVLISVLTWYVLPRITDAQAVGGVLTTVTGFFTTLITAFVGVQAASAGRSQALDKVPNATSEFIAYNIIPREGTANPPTTVRITGDGLTGANAVNFDGIPGTDINLENDGALTVKTPLAATGKTGDSDVIVVFPDPKPNRNVGKFRWT
jgi:hypothetical protein